MADFSDKNAMVEKQKLTELEKRIIEDQAVRVLRTCYDPEIPVNIYELGLIYGVDVDDDGIVTVRMTLTTPHCPAAQSLPAEVREKVSTISGVTDVKTLIVWDPPWNPSMMSEAAKLELGM